MPSDDALARLDELQSRQLFSLYGRILDELTARRLVRSRNNPAADYAEWIVAKALDLKLSPKSTRGHDAIDAEDRRYEVKSRRLSVANKSRLLSPFRKLEDRHFDFFVGVLFDREFFVTWACLMSHALVLQQSTFRENVNGHVLHLRDCLWDLQGVQDISFDLQEAQADSLIRPPMSRGCGDDDAHS